MDIRYKKGMDGGINDMEISQVKADIKSNGLKSVYIFTGEELEVMNIYLKQMSMRDKQLVRVDTFRQVYKDSKSPKMMGSPKLYVVRDDNEILTNEKIHKLLDNTDWLKVNILVVVFSNVDKRSKFYKTYKDSIVEFNSLDSKILKKYIQKQINLSDKNCDKLIEVCEGNYGRILLEIDKIKNHAKATQAEDMSNNVFELLLFDGTIYQPPKDAIFDFVDAVLNRSSKCFDLYEQCLAVGEASMVMLSVLYNNAKQTLQVQSCQSKDVSKSTGLTGWQIQNAKKYVGKWKTWELVNILKMVRSMETGIKTGKIEEQMTVPYILVNIL